METEPVKMGPFEEAMVFAPAKWPLIPDTPQT